MSTVQYSTPSPEGAEYIAVCLPAFSPDTVKRDEPGFPGWPHAHDRREPSGRFYHDPRDKQAFYWLDGGGIDAFSGRDAIRNALPPGVG